jgi:hypothetical protein
MTGWIIQPTRKKSAHGNLHLRKKAKAVIARSVATRQSRNIRLFEHWIAALRSQ